MAWVSRSARCCGLFMWGMTCVGSRTSALRSTSGGSGSRSSASHASLGEQRRRDGCQGLVTGSGSRKNGKWSAVGRQQQASL